LSRSYLEETRVVEEGPVAEKEADSEEEPIVKEELAGEEYDIVAGVTVEKVLIAD
jgi:hypothetical protein